MTSDAPDAPRTASELERILLADLRKCVDAYDALGAVHAASVADPVDPPTSEVEPGGYTSDGYAVPPLRLASREVEVTDENREIDTDRVRDVLTAEYEAWLETQGLDLGSADEHIFDTSLTLAQLEWVRDFTERWERNDALADAKRRSMHP